MPILSMLALSLGSVIWAFTAIAPDDFDLFSILISIWALAPFVAGAAFASILSGGSWTNIGSGLVCSVANITFWYFMYVAYPDGLAFIFVPFGHWVFVGVLVLLAMGLDNALSQMEKEKGAG